MSYTCLNPTCDGDLNADLVGGHYEAVCAKCMSPAPLVNVLRERERLLKENERLRELNRNANAMIGDQADEMDRLQSEHEANLDKIRDLIRQEILTELERLRTYRKENERLRERIEQLTPKPIPDDEDYDTEPLL